MRYFVEELKNKKILAADDIKILKDYINKKYSEATSKERAQMLSNTIHHILDSNLKEFPKKYRQAIRIDILKNTFSQNKTSIFMYDVFNCCMKNQSLKQNSKKEILKWVNANIKNKIQENDLNIYTRKAETTLVQDAKTPVGSIDINTSYSDIYMNLNNSITMPVKPLKITKNFKLNKKFLTFIIIIIILISGISVQLLYGKNILKTSLSLIQLSKKNSIYIKSFIEDVISENYGKNYPNKYLPQYLKYQRVDTYKLKAFLNNRNSLLCNDPYFSTIMNTAKEFNLNPILLFAITGQEQNFVPVDTPNAYKIANNPFNVYHSWQEYNTNINDSSRIAANTIINLSENRPEENNPFMWIGKKYAEDVNWGSGVQCIFEEINNYYVSPNEK
ncbi:hypothetical protein ACJDU8_21250 [Clostridium sp. WILCCON 0269]|uniref:Mannosyl-glycoprotein endo-beta-N-acetylglucosamidase-like domain-containing protein n=1 Tax=Candidatus Clostridium eludens TaxID=3381663 RepID=A0ABW8SPT6_9CLOT